MSGFCEHPDCAHIRLTPKEGRTEFCATRNKAIRKQEEEDAKPAKEFKPIKRRSDKRADQEREYNARVKKFLEGKQCAVFPGNVATQVHHRAGRENDMLLDEEFWLPVSDEGHKFIHDNPIYSKNRGFMVLRSVTNKKTI